MLFRKHIVSMRTLLQLSVASVVFVGGAGAAFAAAGAGVAPVLVPYTVNALAGNEQPNSTAATALPSAGYGGDGKTGLLTTLNSPNALAVDAAGNVYWADTSNAVIRELNAQTGIVNTIAGVPPTSCIGYQNTSCSKVSIGCAEAVPALNNPIGGKIVGLAVDANDNVYFADSAQFTISVIYHAGTQIANFIKTVDPAGVTAAGGVVQGYVYHIGGSINLTSCVGTKGNLDNVLAFQNAQMSNTAGQIALDGAGNLYIQDVGNNVVRVINTQSTTQQFFQTTVQPGYMRAIVNCSGALTVLCPGVVTPTAGTGITFVPNSQQQPGSTVVDGPANALTYNTETGMGVDGYGNVYQVNNKNATPGIYASVSMAGSTPLGHYLNVLWPGINIAYGDAYEAVGDISRNDSLGHWYDNILANAAGSATGTAIVRPTNITADPLGNIWAYDNHWPSIFRMDVNSGILVDVIGFGGGNGGTSNTPSGKGNAGTSTLITYGSYGAPIWCITSNGVTPFGAGPTSNDGHLDGCPAKVSTTSGNGEIISDGFGNIYNADTSFNEIRELSLDNVFPSTAIGGKVTQAIDVHFDASNPPVVTGVTTAAFSFSTGNTDFSIDTTDPEFQALLWFPAAYATSGSQNSIANNTIALYAGAPSCIQAAAPSGDASWDCLVYVTFSPTAGGLRETQLVATTANGGVYTFPLVGTGTGGQLSIDGGQQIQVPATGLGATSSVAVDSTGKVYIADAANNRIVVCVQGSGSLCKTQTVLAPVFPTTVTTTTLSGPMGVAVDSNNNIYIADTGNNRILEVNPQTSAATVLGGIEWVSCQPTQAANLTSPKATPCPVVPSGTAPPANPNLAANPAVIPGPIPVYNPLQQYLFKAPQGLAVDLNGNVYVADTGNAAIVEIPKNPVLGGATPLFQYTGAPTFVTPVAVAVDPSGNVYVADTGNPFQQVVKIAPGGGDFQNLLPLNSHLPLIGGQSISTPNGVAVDAGGNVFISDSGSNSVWEAPAAGPPNGPPFTLSFIGLSSPAGLALDTGGNLFVADSGNKQILYVNRQNPTVNFGIVPQDLAPTGVPGTPVGCLLNGSSTVCTGVMTVTNSGNQPIAVSEPIATLSPGSPAFAVKDTCTSSPLLPGATCTIAPTFQPTSNGPQSATATVNGSSGQSIALVANGSQPQAKIVLTGAYSGGTPTTGGTATLTATVSQPHVPPGGTPTGTVTFVITIDSGLYAAGACGANTTVTVPLAGGVATTAINPLLQGRIYSVVATYNGDTLDSPIASTALPIVVPPIPITATAASLSFVYGVKPGTITGTITGVDSSVTAAFTSAASQFSPVSGSPYPVTIAFSGGDFCNYGNPPVYNPGTTTQAVVAETPTTLKDTLSTFTSLYGAPDINFALGLAYIGAVNGDQNKLTPSFYLTNPATPVKSSLLGVAGSPYTINPIFSGKPISPFNDYTPTYSPGTLIINQAPSQIGTVTTTAFTANTTVNSKIITAVSSTQGLVVGAAVSGTNIATGSTVTAISGTSITLSAAATATSPVASPGPPPVVAAPVTVTYTFKNAMLSTALVTGTFSAQVSTAVPGGIGTATGTVTVYDTTTPITSTAPGLGTVILPCTLPFVAATTSGSPTVTVTSAYDLAAGEAVTGPGIPSGTTIASAGVTSITLSANATATASFVILTSATNTTPCNAPIPLPSLVNGLATFTPTNTAIGLHQYAFYYTGDTNFLPSVLVPATVSASAPACAPAAITANCELVDVGDFAMTSTTGVLPIVPGVTPSGNGLLAAPGQNSTYPESASISIVSLLSQTGVVSLSCLPIGNPTASTFTGNTTTGSPTISAVSNTSGLTPGYPITGAGIPSGATIASVGATTVTISANATATATGVTVSFIVPPPANAGTASSYIQCAMTPPAVTLTAGGTSTTVLSVFTPVTEPLGYKYFTSSTRMPGAETVLAFLPLGMLAFCMRRRRRLSKVLWMLLAIAAVTAGMSGCGGNLVDFYAPIPQGPQYVQITATANSITSPNVTETRTYLVQIYID